MLSIVALVLLPILITFLPFTDLSETLPAVVEPRLEHDIEARLTVAFFFILSEQPFALTEMLSFNDSVFDNERTVILRSSPCA